MTTSLDAKNTFFLSSENKKLTDLNLVNEESEIKHCTIKETLFTQLAM